KSCFVPRSARIAPNSLCLGGCPEHRRAQRARWLRISDLQKQRCQVAQLSAGAFHLLPKSLGSASSVSHIFPVSDRNTKIEQWVSGSRVSPGPRNSEMFSPR